MERMSSGGTLRKSKGERGKLVERERLSGGALVGECERERGRR